VDFFDFFFYSFLPSVFVFLFRLPVWVLFPSSPPKRGPRTFLSVIALKLLVLNLGSLVPGFATCTLLFFFPSNINQHGSRRTFLSPPFVYGQVFFLILWSSPFPFPWIQPSAMSESLFWIALGVFYASNRLFLGTRPCSIPSSFLIFCSLRFLDGLALGSCKLFSLPEPARLTVQRIDMHEHGRKPNPPDFFFFFFFPAF